MPLIPGSLGQRRGSPVAVIGPGGRTVVAAVGGEHLVAAGVQARHPHGVLGGLGAAVGEEHPVQRAGGQAGDESRCLGTGLVGEARRDGALPGRGLLDRGDELRVLVADVDVDQLAGEVEVALALEVPEVAARRGGDRQRVDQRLRRPRVEDVGAVVTRDLRATRGVGVELRLGEGAHRARPLVRLRSRRSAGQPGRVKIVRCHGLWATAVLSCMTCLTLVYSSNE